MGTGYTNVTEGTDKCDGADRCRKDKTSTGNADYTDNIVHENSVDGTVNPGTYRRLRRTQCKKHSWVQTGEAKRQCRWYIWVQTGTDNTDGHRQYTDVQLIHTDRGCTCSKYRYKPHREAQAVNQCRCFHLTQPDTGSANGKDGHRQYRQVQICTLV